MSESQVASGFYGDEIKLDAIDSSVEQPDQTTNDTSPTEDQPETQASEDQPVEASADDEQLTPAQLKVLHEWRQKDKGELDELRNEIRAKENQDKQTAERIIGDIMRDPTKLAGYMQDYGLASKEEEKPPEFDTTAELTGYTVKKAVKEATAEATRVARDEAASTSARLQSNQRVTNAWQELVKKDPSVESNPARKEAVQALAIAYGKDPKKYNGSNEEQLIMKAYETVVGASQNEKKPVPEIPTEIPRSASKTVPKSGGNKYADVMRRIDAKTAAINKTADGRGEKY